VGHFENSGKIAANNLYYDPEDMAWAKLQYSRKQVNQAGIDLKRLSPLLASLPLWQQQYDHAVEIVDI
jgi:hypothetical protein